VGAGNAIVVTTLWSQYLNDRPFRALVYMALVSLDDAADPRYWAGWQPLAHACGSPAPRDCETGTAHTDGERECKECAASQRVVRRAVAGLVAAGAVTLIRRPRKGVNAEYSLRLTAVPDGTKKCQAYGSGPKSRRTLSVLQTSDAERPTDVGRSASTLQDAERPTEEYQEENSGTQPGTTSALVPTSPAPVDDAPPAAPNDPAELISCPSCRWLLWEGHAPDCQTPNLRALRGTA